MITKYKIFERYDIVERKVYWISAFNEKLEDSLVKLVRQYKGQKDEYEAIENIDYALGIANTARKELPKKDFVIITMEFKIRDEEVISGPSFDIYQEKDKSEFDRTGYIFVGFAPNTNKEEYEIYKKSKKYNL